MGAGQALGGFQLCPPVAFQVILQLGSQSGNRGKGIRNSGNRFVFQQKILFSPGKMAVILGGRLAKPLLKPGPVGNQPRAHLAKPQIVLRQDGFYRRIIKPVF